MDYKTVLGKKVELTTERKAHIAQRHPDIVAHFPKIKKALLFPNEIRIDSQDPGVLLFYKFFSTIGNGKYLVVVVKINERSFIITCYSTYRIRTGIRYEHKKPT